MPRAASSIIHPGLVDHLAAWRGRGLPDTCTIKRVDPDSEPTVNPTTFVLTPAAPTTVYSGACMVQPARNTERDLVAGDERTVLSEYVASIPLAETDPIPGDLLTVTASDDPGLLGRSFVIIDVGADSVPSRRLLRLVDQAPAERGDP